ncbi:hypothetical protein K2173_027986 [Erythroxylum novogranatense]|uniref:DUF7875 domain-containing protein n=1 Tax=Erythroxylum novogranatense TaxID=1862640 RepID=A0AAV8U3K0_9ROSI|nr:hypothetical protein K2173_027986 [Erythroxylum novogranatense]
MTEREDHEHGEVGFKVHVSVIFKGEKHVTFRRFFGFSDGELMRSDAQGFWVLCILHYGPRITIPQSLQWASCGAIFVSLTTALLVRLFSPECEPQNIATYDSKSSSSRA